MEQLSIFKKEISTDWKWSMANDYPPGLCVWNELPTDYNKKNCSKAN